MRASAELRIAVWLWIASLVLGVAEVAISFGSIGPEIRRELAAQLADNPDLASMDPDTVVRIAGYAVLAVSLLGIALRAFFVVKLAQGRRWARTVLTALGALSVVASVISVRAAGPLDAALGVLGSLLIAGAIVYMFSAGAQASLTPKTSR